MSTRSVRFFMLPEEFQSWLSLTVGELELFLVLRRRGRVERAERGAGLQLSDGARADEVYLSSERPADDQLTGSPAPGKFGWVESHVPQIESGCLYLADLGSRSDFYDERMRVVVESTTSHELFQKVAPRLKRQLRFPAWATDMIGGSSKLVRGLGFSTGVVAWVKGGGSLKQRGVANVAYRLSASDE